MEVEDIRGLLQGERGSGGEVTQLVVSMYANTTRKSRFVSKFL